MREYYMQESVLFIVTHIDVGEIAGVTIRELVIIFICSMFTSGL
jgi:hypothetical protein